MPHLAIDGGPKVYDGAWPTWPIWGDEERQGLSDVLESGQWWYGRKVAEFEAAFARFQGARYGVTATSGTTALEVALLALGIGAGDEVIVPPYTFVATVSAVLRVNAIPIFADVEPDTLCLDPADAARKITDRTRAIIPVHLAGYVADMDRLTCLARAHHLALVEDACHSWGSQWKGKGTGALGHCGVFSFQASKNINSGEGGIILTDDEELARTCRSLTNCGRVQGKAWYEHYILASNLRLTEFQAALLLAQLTRLEEQTLRREANAAHLTAGLRHLPGIVTLRDEPRLTRRAYHLYPFRLDLERLGVTRARFVAAMVAEGIPVGEGYPTPLYKNPLFAHTGEGPEFCPVSCPYYGGKVDYSQASCPVCEAVCRDTCWIGHAALLAEPEAIDAIIEAAAKVCAHAEELR